VDFHEDIEDKLVELGLLKDHERDMPERVREAKLAFIRTLTIR